MFFEKFGFSAPGYLWLFLLLPAVWWLSRRSLSGLGYVRGGLALALRLAVVSGLILALAGIQWRQENQRISVFFLLDQSESIPAARRSLMMEYVSRQVEKYRRLDREDRAGVIIFGGNPAVEFPAIDSPLPNFGRFEAALNLRENATNLEAALRMARASFPDDTSKRVVLVSDGNENVGDALVEAQRLVDDGIGIDVVPVQLLWDQDVSVDRISVPSNLRVGQNYDVRVVVSNHPPSQAPELAKVVKGKLRITKRVGRAGAAADAEVLSETDVELEPGPNVFSIPQRADESSLVNLDALFIPDEGQIDNHQQNNQAAAYTNVQGQGRVLFIEDGGHLGEFDGLVKLMRRNDISVDILTTAQLYTSLDELIPYDLVVLANVPRSGGDDVETGFTFSDEQISMLVDNTERMGSGLLILGGDRSYGAGGWNSTKLEEALPIDFEIRNDKVAASGALVMILHACETPNGNHWQKVIAREALNVLGPIDYCGILGWDNFKGVDDWLWKLPVGLDKVTPQNKNRMLGILGRMAPGDMPNFQPAMQKGLAQLLKNPASAKQMIIISDGDPSAPTPALLGQFKQNQIVISTVAVGSHGPADHQTLKNIAQATGGRYYAVNNNRALPRIFQREARRVTKPLIFEPEGGIKALRTSVAGFHPMTRDIKTDELPNYRGYVYTTIKQSELVEQLLIASSPDDGGLNSTLLATWQFGLGRSTVFTSDAGFRWTQDWIDNPLYDQLFMQIVRQTMRTVSRQGDFQLVTQQRGNMTEVVVTAADPDGKMLNELKMQSSVVTPEGPKPLNFQQVAPGRYVANYESIVSGNYVLSVFPDEGYQRLTAGLVVPKSTEFEVREANRPLLEQLAKLKPKDGEIGRVIGDDLAPETMEQLLSVDAFADTLPWAKRFSDIWTWVVVLTSGLLFVDVLNRRVALDGRPLGRWIGRQWRRLTGGKEAPELASRMDRLKAKKQAVESEREDAGRRFQFDDNQAISAQSVIDTVEEARQLAAKRPTPVATPSLQNEEKSAGYTERLLAAKRKAQVEKKEKDEE
ncbi:MAG: VWA domain-containing protein [Planctomycetaceae bacterium]|nr:VWA domain-containing protein [Planctomycetaceae bacterium]